MMELNEQQIVDQFNELLGLIDTHIADPRKDKLKRLYTDHEERIALMPASGVEHYHNAFPGGYVDHILRVVKCALSVRENWLAMGAVEDHTVEELVFAAINHDLGKIGTEAAEMYQPNDSEWHRKNLGKLYKNNPENPFMTVPDRSLFLLQARGISVTFNEYLGIKLHDGLYDEGNKPYYISHEPTSKLRTNLPYILHQADLMASRIEYERWITSKEPKVDKVVERPKSKQIPTQSTSDLNRLSKAFDELFKD